MAVFKSSMAREPNIRTLCHPPASHGHCWPLPPPQWQLQTLLPSLQVQNLTEMFCRNQDKRTAGQLFSPPYCPATSYRAQKTGKIRLSFCFTLLASSCFADCSEVEAGLCPSSGGFLGYITASELLAEESPGSTEVQPGGEGAQDVLYLLMPQP